MHEAIHFKIIFEVDGIEGKEGITKALYKKGGAILEPAFAPLKKDTFADDNRC